MKKGPNPKLFLIMGVTTLVAGAGGVYVQYGTLSSTEARIQTLKKDVRDPKSMQAEVDQSAKQLADCLTELNHLEKGVPETAYIPTLLTDLEKSGNANGIKVTGVRPVPKVAAKDDKATRKPYDELDIEVKGTGNYASVMKFVSALNSFPKIVAARMVTLSPKSDSSKTGPGDTLDVQIQLRAYIFSAKDKTAGGMKQDG